MFYTLKHTNLNDESYSFETTAPPFSKKREGRLAKVACTNCRISKLKCSGEPNSCQRCLSKKMECQYPSPPRNKQQKKSPSPTETPPRGPTSAPSVPSLDTPIEDDFMSVVSNQDGSYTASLQDLTLGFDVADFTAPDNASALLADTNFLDQPDVLKQWTDPPFPFTANTAKAPWNDIPELDDMDFSAGDKTSPTVSSMGTTDSNCSCFVQAVSTHEAIEVVVWGQKESANIADDILQHQKKALVECEDLLDCPKCNTQPAYIMLLLSMCSKILGTLEEICNGGSSSSRASSADNDSNSMVLDQGPETRKRKKNDMSDVSGGGGGLGMVLRKRQLDDDDEHLILQSLLSARVSKLDRLLSMLDTTVSRHNWPAHKGLIQELQNRLTSGAFVVNNNTFGAWTG